MSTKERASLSGQPLATETAIATPTFTLKSECGFGISPALPEFPGTPGTIRLAESPRRDFLMPSVQTMVSRKSSITNAFVNAIIPTVSPTEEEIGEALNILGMVPGNVRCVYCGDGYSEWDHLRPLVLNRRPTGYISEIANLVPSCGKCNQSKGNKNWFKWINGKAPQSPKTRGIGGLEQRIERLRAYEKWREVQPIDFAAMVGQENWLRYWRTLEAAVDYLKESQPFADELRDMIALAHH